MSEDLDRRVAIEVMGEQEPSSEDAHKLFDEVFDDRMFLRGDNHSPGRNWHIGRVDESSGLILPRWQPNPFSSVLEEALRAVGKYTSDFGTNTVLFMEYLCDIDGDYQQPFTAGLLGEAARGQTLPKAICNLLLALKEKE